MNKSAITDHVAKENNVKLFRCQNFGKRRTGKPGRSRSRYSILFQYLNYQLNERVQVLTVFVSVKKQGSEVQNST